MASAGPLTDPGDLAIDKFVDRIPARFEPIKRAGSGGEGVPYICKDKNDPQETRVVVKVCSDESMSLDDSPADRMRNEIGVLKLLPSHERIFQIVDFEDDESVRFPWLCTNEVVGGTLRAFFTSSGLGEAEKQGLAWHFGVQMGEAVAWIHFNLDRRQGETGQATDSSPSPLVVHRDITANNVLVDMQSPRQFAMYPNLVLIDFMDGVVYPVDKELSPLEQEVQKGYMKQDAAQFSTVFHWLAHDAPKETYYLGAPWCSCGHAHQFSSGVFSREDDDFMLFQNFRNMADPINAEQWGLIIDMAIRGRQRVLEGSQEPAAEE